MCARSMYGMVNKGCSNKFIHYLTTLFGSVLGNLAFLSRESPSRESTNTLTGIPYNAQSALISILPDIIEHFA